MNQDLDRNGKKSIISLAKISRIYHMEATKVVALDEVSLIIYKGEFLVILGPSGSGKTTLLNLIGGIDSPSSGEVIVDEIPLKNKKDLQIIRREKIGFVFQFFNLIPTLTARENVEYAMELVKKSKKNKSTNNTAQGYLQLVGLKDRINHFPSQLSGGEQQRVAIARALAKDPLVILADEPTGELDFKTGIMILEVLQDLVNQYAKTVVLVTHNQEIAKIADRIIRLSDGKISQIIDNREKKLSPDKLNW